MIIDSNDVKENAYRELFADVAGGPDVVNELLADDRRSPCTRRETIRRISRLAVRRGLCGSALAEEPSIDALTRRYTRLCRAGIARAPLMSGAAKALQRISASLPAYVNSLTPQEELDWIVDRRRLRDFFEAVLGTPPAKPDNLVRIAEARGVSCATLVMVGDSQSDADAAHAVGCRFVAFLTDEARFGDPSTLTVVARSWQELEARLIG